jgi:hypothetical protein
MGRNGPCWVGGRASMWGSGYRALVGVCGGLGLACGGPGCCDGLCGLVCFTCFSCILFRVFWLVWFCVFWGSW